MPCPHHDIKIVQRSNRQSAVAAAAYQSGERLFSEYDQKQKYYAEKRGIVHTEIMLPPHAPPEYADRNTLWNAAEAVEKQWNSQLARRIVLAIPREIPRSQYADLIRDYCREFFISKGMIADFAIHDKEDGNPHAHILLTMRAMDETGRCFSPLLETQSQGIASLWTLAFFTDAALLCHLLVTPRSKIRNTWPYGISFEQCLHNFICISLVTTMFKIN